MFVLPQNCTFLTHTNINRNVRYIFLLISLSFPTINIVSPISLSFRIQNLSIHKSFSFLSLLFPIFSLNCF
ncbi:hypothetical protein LINGRAHAP2_LOCUS27904 [Linum grandiflorum]